MSLSGMMNEKTLSTISNLPYPRPRYCEVPDFIRDFNLYTFAFDQSLAVVLTQKDNDKNEAPMSFMSTNLQGAEINYPAIDKYTYAVYKEVKHFRSYILKNHTKVTVLHPAVRSLFTQQEMGEIRGNWMASSPGI
jgi:hypothetical protein